MCVAAAWTAFENQTRRCLTEKATNKQTHSIDYADAAPVVHQLLATDSVTGQH